MIRVEGNGVNTYEAFKALVDAFGARKASVIYKTDGTSYFIVVAQAGDVGVSSSLNETKPLTFDADFPQAVQVDANTGVSVI